MKTFEELGVIAPIREAIEELGFIQPMPVQEAVIPFLIDGQRDVIALAQTGTGKTAAFGIPLLQRLDTSCRDTQALVLSPTRELCLQITDDLRDFSKHLDDVHVEAVYGGAAIEAQMRALRKGVNIIVATPGRLIDLKNRGFVHLENVGTIVLDEADEMLNMGFADSIGEIFQSLPAEHATLMFSATMSREVEKVAKTYLKDGYETIVVGSRNEGAENVNHIYYMVQAKDKYLALKRIVDYNPRIFAIIFCRTKIETQEIADKLIKDGYNAESLHGDLSQQQRDLTMQKFRHHLTQLLVATDVAARGLDVDDLTHVINFGLPDDIENYTHRSGRTGRAGKKGTSISIVHSKEKHKIRAIEKEIGKSFVETPIPQPEEICKKQLYKVMDQIVKTDVDDQEIAPFMQDISRYFEYMDKEEIIKKIVSLEFGKFLAYYADAPEISLPTVSSKEKGGSKPQTDRQKRMNKAQPGYHRLFINLGKRDGFYPGELMQTLNRYVGGRQEVGHIDLLDTISYFEVPEKDALKVMTQLTGIRFHGRQVRCNSEDDKGLVAERPQQSASRNRGGRSDDAHFDKPKRGGRSDDAHFDKPKRGGRSDDAHFDKPKRGGRSDSSYFDKPKRGKRDDWRELMKPKPRELRGPEPDFTEEGWARRKPKKRK
ncbi:MAG: DEAD/DEAH box helicase [Prevotella sp.]|nr:DEAD/DEAH box helicase [Prevotella sp.]